MSEWYEKKYFNKMAWIFEELENLNLTPTETIMILTIQYFNQTQTPITFDLLSAKCHLSEEEVDEMLDVLSQKGYVEVDFTGNGFAFTIDGIFKKSEEIHFDSNLFDLFESEFKRTLSSTELQKLSDWSRTYSEETIKFALRDASLREKLSFNYIQQILINRGLSNENDTE